MGLELKRVPIKVSESGNIDQELLNFSELAASAEKELGYTGLAKNLSEETSKKLVLDILDQVAKVFKDLGIDPLDKETVEKYKETNRWKRSPFLSKVFDAVLSALSIIFVFGIAMSANSVIHFLPVANNLLNCLGITAAAFVSFFAVIMLTNGRIKEAKWEIFPLSEYTKMIPEFAVQTAIDIKRRIPEACFYVDELIFATRPDPFLVMEDALKNRYYLEVWNEPKFKQSRTV